MISTISTLEVLKDYFKNSGNIVIYRYEPRLLKKFIGDLKDMGYDIKYNTNYKDIVFFSKSNMDDIKEIDRLLKRNKFEYFME